MAEAEPAALLSALRHNTSLQLTAGLPNARGRAGTFANRVARRLPSAPLLVCPAEETAQLFVLHAW